MLPQKMKGTKMRKESFFMLGWWVMANGDCLVLLRLSQIGRLNRKNEFSQTLEVKNQS